MWTQAVAARTVAEALVDAATDESPDSPALVEVAGPREESMVALAQRYATRHQPGLKIVAVPTPEGPDQKIYDEGGLPRPGCPAGRPHVRGVAGLRLEPGHPGGRGRRPP